MTTDFRIKVALLTVAAVVCLCAFAVLTGLFSGESNFESSEPFPEFLESKLSSVVTAQRSQDTPYEELYVIYEECCTYIAEHPNTIVPEELLTEFSLLMLRGEWNNQNGVFMLRYVPEIGCTGEKFNDYLVVSDWLASVKMSDKAYYYYFDISSRGELIIGFEEAAGGEMMPNFRINFAQDGMSVYNFADGSAEIRSVWICFSEKLYADAMPWPAYDFDQMVF